MKAVAVAPKTKTLELIRLAAPRLEHPSDVLVRMLDVGVCGTDREICAFDYGTPPAGSRSSRHRSRVARRGGRGRRRR